MNGIFSIEFSNHLVAALLHTLWQGAAIAGVLWIVLRALPARQANARYGACVVALLAMVIAFSITWDLLDRKALPQPIAASVQSTLTISSPPAEASAGSLSLHEIAKAKVQKPATIEWMRVAAMAWVGGVVIMMLRAMRALVGAGRLRRRCVPIEAPAMVLLLDVVRSSMRIARRVKLAASEQITSPAVIGILWPTILLPASVISGTDAQTLRMILAHELAHVRRHDYLVNLFQLLIEAILFFNPAVWWISRQIRIEREACCDARAIASGAAPSDYVRALAGFAQGLAKPQAAVMSMSGNQQPGGLLDRVRRALAPQHRPGLRLPWYSLTGSLIVGALVLGSVWRTSVAAVELAEKLLTPEERIAKAKEAQKEYSQGSTYRGKMNVVGTVKTADGKKLPRGMYISLHVTNQGSSMGTSERVNDNGEFHRNDLDGGVVTITVAAPGYAPAFSGPVTPDENGKLDPINLVLEPGFIATFHVTDENGTPVNNALIGGGFVKGESTCNAIDLKTGADGTATTDSGADLPLNVSIEADGFEPASYANQKLSRNDPFELKLTHAKPTTGVVVDKASGKPLAGAKIRIAAVMGPEQHVDLDENQKPAAVTDAQGRFTLNKLRSDSTYVLWVTAAKHGHELVHDIVAGKNDVEIKLGEGIIYKGKITGALDKLYKGKGNERYVTYSVHRELNNNGWGSSANAPVTIKDGVGTFEIDDIWPGNMNISTPVRSFTFNVEESRDDIVLELTKEPEKPKVAPKRKVIITFNTPEGAPAPTGTIGITADKSLPGNGVVPIKDGKVEFEIETPAHLGYKPVGTLGYSFNEEFGKEVPDGTDPIELKIDVIAAGAIFGKVSGAIAGKDLPGNCLLSIVTVKSAGSNIRVDTQERVKSDGKFFVGGIPLGGTYRILAHIERQFTISDPIELDESQPLREIELKFAEGVTVECNVTDTDGKPLGKIPVDFSAQLANGGWGFSPLATTDLTGKVRYEHVVPDVAEYTLAAKPKRDYQPMQVKIDFNSLPIQMKLEKGLVLAGVVKSESTGDPVRGLLIKAASGNNVLEAEGVTNEKGEFRFSNLGPGDWMLTCDDYQRISDAKPMKVTISDQNDPVDYIVKMRDSK